MSLPDTHSQTVDDSEEIKCNSEEMKCNSEEMKCNSEEMKSNSEEMKCNSEWAAVMTKLARASSYSSSTAAGTCVSRARARTLSATPCQHHTSTARHSKVEWEQQFRKKVDVLDKHKERALCRVATRGVVQLFNAVKQQQKDTGSLLAQCGSSTIRRHKILASVNKQQLLDRLNNNNNDNNDNNNKQGSAAGWSVLNRHSVPHKLSLKDWQQGSNDDDDDNSDIEDDVMHSTDDGGDDDEV